MSFGKNQKIAIVGYSIPILLSLPLLYFFDTAQLEVWLPWVGNYVHIAIGTIIGASAVIKAAVALRK
jgi:hypothetical protein